MTIRQFKMLHLFTERNFQIESALELDQRTFGSLCKQEWIEYSLRVGFKLSRTGFEIHHTMSEYGLSWRKHNNGKFSIRVPNYKRVIEMRRAS